MYDKGNLQSVLDYFHYGFLEQLSGGVCACHWP